MTHTEKCKGCMYENKCDYVTCRIEEVNKRENSCQQCDYGECHECQQCDYGECHEYHEKSLLEFFLTKENEIKNRTNEIKNRTIDDFAKRLKSEYEKYDIDDVFKNSDIAYTDACYIFEQYIEQIAEQLKAGEQNDR